MSRRQVIQSLGALPGVAAIFLSGSHAQGRANKDSDVDLFIIAYPSQIWTARFYVCMYLFLTRNMRRPGKEAGKYCPNHFITTDNLEIQEKDAYSANLFSNNVPLYDVNNIFIQFVKQNQQWVQDFGEAFPEFPDAILNEEPIEIPVSEKTDSREKFLRWLQIRKIKKNPQYKTKGAKIILTDKELRFHPNPKNKTYTKK